MAQPTLSGLKLNLGTGGSDLLYDSVSSKIAQVVLQAYSTGDGALNVVMTDAPLPVDLRADNVGGIEVLQDTAADLNCTEASAAAILAKLTTMDVDTSALFGCVGGTELQVDIVSSALPSGAATSALQTTGNAILTTIDADTGDIKTAVQLLDNAVDGNYLNVNLNAAGTDLSMNAGVLTAQTQRVTIATDDECNNLLGTIDADTSALFGCVAGTELQVDVVGALPAGTALLGKVGIDQTTPGTTNHVAIISGQAGIAGGAGTMGATVARVTLATDDTHFGAVGAAADVDGVIHGQLEYIGTGIDTQLAFGTGAMAAAHAVTLATDDTQFGAVGVAASVTGAVHAQLRYFGETLATQSGKITACNTGAVVLATGSAAIGKLAANTGVDIGDVDVTSISAGTNTVGGVISQASSSIAYDGTTACTIKRAFGLAATGTVAMVTPTAGYQVRVLALSLIATSATVTNIYLANGDFNILGDTDNRIPLGIDADGDMIPGITLPFNRGGWFQTDTDTEALNIVLSAAQDVIYCVTYIEVT